MMAIAKRVFASPLSRAEQAHDMNSNEPRMAEDEPARRLLSESG
jgi:hypothetical protein